MGAPTPQDLAAGVPQGANIVKRVAAPSGKGELLLDANGGVYDTGGSSFSGSYWSLRPEDRQGTRQFTDLRVDPKTGGYTLVSNIPGQEYNFGPSEHVKNMPRANPLYSDPAFLAYVANAGKSYETAAGDVAKRKAALTNALGLDVAAIKDQGKENVESVYKNFANRGLYGAGQQAVEEGKEQNKTLGAIARAEADTANQIGELETGLVSKRSEILDTAATMGADTASTQDLSNTLSTIDKKYPLGDKTGLKY